MQVVDDSQVWRLEEAALKAWLKNPGVYRGVQLSVCADVSNSLGLVLEETDTSIDVGV